ncbi:50S ribosomal protein L18 [Viridibacillus sp. FSL R5-0477]|uniref:Large ribosomal subunit protein uL18 n=2 Tax=Viridibacillus TaxID=496496 RepID=W4F8N1_9BACL|nr:MULTISPECIES: 50S ribosomal protein L18 [Viridibacillus]ETT88692.1 50S ribosomal protein L18 [Viridibacillus arenosi FSL R5-213]KOO48428.1 50S ribosomal protein L18 [Viridibacillus arvi]OMC81238.1 50S ribosomal protein L18 [Viridibacillus sp. FSL H8-0123]OMC85009.1 50S ribosomal protein L18 [Viridibacillus sp. FSL H7-0596]OMC90300.1 50S ribosomal protein L18 [Viridibacillus arenosi]
MITKQDKNQVRKKRHARVRSKITGTAECPRLNVFRSNKHIYAQIIDDSKGLTLVSASTMDKEFEGTAGNLEAATKIGETIAKGAAEKNIKAVVFDRGGYLYHGRVKALAEAARANGLEF